MPLLAVLGNGRKRVLAARASRNVGRPSPLGTAAPLKRITGPTRWEDLTKAQKLQIQRQFLYGGMPYNPSGTYWSLMQYPKQVGGFRLWKQSQFVGKNGSCCRNAPRCRHNGRSWMTPSPTAPWPSEGFKLREAIMDRRDAIRKVVADFWVDVPSEDAILDRRAPKGEYIRAMKKVERAEKLIARLKALKNPLTRAEAVDLLQRGQAAARRASGSSKDRERAFWSGVSGGLGDAIMRTTPSKDLPMYFRNAAGRKYRRNSVLPMVAGGVAAGVAGAVANRILRNPSPIAFGKGQDGAVYKVVRKSSTGEWVVRAYVGGKYHEGRTYYTTDKQDALGTLRAMVGPGGKCWSPEVAHGPKLDSNRRRVRKNSGAAQTEITVPFRVGRKYSVAQVQNWVEKHGTPEMKKRFAQAMAQYRRFHQGSLPKFITYSLYKMGSHQGISDVEFGVSEGREWMAAYQVPKTSGKWKDKASAGRYVHAHGDSDIEVDIKRPVKLSKLPMRFHTPDGKAVGVIPSKNVKIGEWYEG